MNIYVEKLKAIAGQLQIPMRLPNIVLDDERFALWTAAGSPDKHHYGKGKLAEHVLEVCELCLQNNLYFPESKRCNEQKLFLAALYHDSGKMWDYEATNDFLYWRCTNHKYSIHHISRSGLLWNESAKSCGWKTEDIDEVWHAILSHHNLREYGSPVQPRTTMAWLLHLCDSLSARVDECSR